MKRTLLSLLFLMVSFAVFSQSKLKVDKLEADTIRIGIPLFLSDSSNQPATTEWIKRQGFGTGSSYSPDTGRARVQLITGYTFKKVTDSVQANIPTNNSQLLNGAGFVTSAYTDAHYSVLSHTHTFSSLTGKPTTISGYGITDAFTQSQANGLYATINHTHTFSSITSKPTTLSGYGITDAYPLNGNPSNFLTTITSSLIVSALGYTPYSTANPSGYIAQSTADTRYPLLSGSYTNPLWLVSIPWSKITATPTTLAGYGITNVYTKAQTDSVAIAHQGSGGGGTGSCLDPNHPVTTGSTPTITDASGGKISSISVNGTDASMDITFTVSAGQTISGVACTITYNSSWLLRPHAVISAASLAATGTSIGGNAINTTTVTVWAQGLTAGTYTYNILSLQ